MVNFYFSVHNMKKKIIFNFIVSTNSSYSSTRSGHDGPLPTCEDQNLPEFNTGSSESDG